MKRNPILATTPRPNSESGSGLMILMDGLGPERTHKIQTIMAGDMECGHSFSRPMKENHLSLQPHSNTTKVEQVVDDQSPTRRRADA